MKIYRIKSDSNNVQAVQPVDHNLIKSNIIEFECNPKIDEWKTLEVYIYNPKTRAKNFYNMGWGILTFDNTALEICQTLFELSGEILPIQVERGPQLFILNVLQCINGLDYDRTIWDYYPTGRKGRILDIKFHENRIGNESTIFKILETCATSIYCFTDERDEDDQFYHLYHKHKLTGLIFEEIDNS